MKREVVKPEHENDNQSFLHKHLSEVVFRLKHTEKTTILITSRKHKVLVLKIMKVLEMNIVAEVTDCRTSSDGDSVAIVVFARPSPAGMSISKDIVWLIFS
jgi:hypothetical protein